ncbi:Conjugal transfer protein TrbC (plasmid) [Thioalkalivibrio sp. K90mix]|uniref:TrbC/VirB2 family protein n=1 Tax=Thioalkalivibrio sp. (strain K90mix) TaxID=396595 RepID=UPI000195A7AE|nr:TrbC/VirB2 family protein [Thioalkalivibrio sp. K90mix]ADC73303.1 Conjugal transfer protein TrbC [Thioalkalivibrio sp. K90mix]
MIEQMKEQALERAERASSFVARHRSELMKWNIVSLLALIVIFTIEPAMAQSVDTTQAMPWEGPLETIMNSLCGPVASMAAVIAFVVTGLLVAFGEANGLFGVMMRIAFGLSIALFSVNFLEFVGVSGFVCGR